MVYDVRAAGDLEANPFPAIRVDLARLGERRREIKRARQVVFVCETGRASYLAARAAAHLGCADAGYLSGGLLAWRAAQG